MIKYTLIEKVKSLETYDIQRLILMETENSS